MPTQITQPPNKYLSLFMKTAELLGLLQFPPLRIISWLGKLPCNMQTQAHMQSFYWYKCSPLLFILANNKTYLTHFRPSTLTWPDIQLDTELNDFELFPITCTNAFTHVQALLLCLQCGFFLYHLFFCQI